jgi:multiple sugar transport system substrate-binding protein
LDTALAQFLSGEITAEQCAKQISDGWNQLTDQIGRDKVLQVYDASLNVTH